MNKFNKMERIITSGGTEQSDAASLLITDKCNLRCSYCFEMNKKSKTMTEYIAKKSVDYFFSDDYKNKYDNINFYFCGGEVLLCIDLLEILMDYIKQKIDSTKKWKTFSFNIITNGTLFSNESVKSFILKNNDLLHISISLDGNKNLQDKNRDNSFDMISNQFDFWKQLKHGVKIKTVINHNSLPNLFENMKFLMNLNVKLIKTKLIMENSDWQENDDKIFYDQLILLADWIIDNNITNNIYLFNYYLFKYNDNAKRACHAGLYGQTIDYDGNILPCFGCMSDNNSIILGNVSTGLDYKKLIPLYFYEYKLKMYTENDCTNCKVKSYCRDCMELSIKETGSIFNMVSHNCKMYVANDKANKYFWNKFISMRNDKL